MTEPTTILTDDDRAFLRGLLDAYTEAAHGGRIMIYIGQPIDDDERNLLVELLKACVDNADDDIRDAGGKEHPDAKLYVDRQEIAARLLGELEA